MNWFNNFFGYGNMGNTLQNNRYYGAQTSNAGNQNAFLNSNYQYNGYGNSGRYYNYANENQPYDNFLIGGFNPGYEQVNVVNTRSRRRAAEQNIDNLGRVGFWTGSQIAWNPYGNSGWGFNNVLG